MAFHKTGRDPKPSHLGFVVPNPRPPAKPTDERPTLTVPPPQPPPNTPAPSPQKLSSVFEPGRDYELVIEPRESNG